jgi:hypothetical protein
MGWELDGFSALGAALCGDWILEDASVSGRLLLELDEH